MKIEPNNSTEKRMTKFAKDLLVGKTIKDVEYLSDFDIDEMLWSKRPIMITFDDDSIMVPMTDDEGNDGGTLHYHHKKSNRTETIGVI
tara:strand:- start:351 stop:614 length:264 start_codon:yes stop_codon:yes gene_type:complete